MPEIELHRKKRAKIVDGVRVEIEAYSGDVTLGGERIGRVSRAMKLHGNPYVWSAVQFGDVRTVTYHRTQADAVRVLLSEECADDACECGSPRAHHLTAGECPSTRGHFRKAPA